MWLFCLLDPFIPTQIKFLATPWRGHCTFASLCWVNTKQIFREACLSYFGGKKLIREFSDEGQNVERLNKLLKKLRHSGIMTTETADVALCVLTRREVLQGTVRTYKTLCYISATINKELPTLTVNQDNESVRQWHFVRQFISWVAFCPGVFFPCDILSGVVFVCGILSHGILSVHRSCRLAVKLALPLTTVSNRAFPIVGPRTWNDLPDDVTSAESLSTFRQRLRTHLFTKSFFDYFL